MTAGSGAKVLLAYSDAATQQARARRPRSSPTGRSPTCAGGDGHRAWPSASRGGERVGAGARRPRAVVAAMSVSGPIDRIGRRPGARWAADLLAAAEALHHRL